MSEEREKREFWAVIEDDVRRVTGFSCGPNVPNYWWCPEVQYSLSVNHHLFETEREACEKLMSELQKRIEAAQETILALRLRLEGMKV